ncbi:AGL304Wp [Eremothecium gossypii ATCC 10895]|uniref:AGL304Wp n=1 Tax=Eremothecium gossypii (strain ATCC 10895 / CBS 109.51 / FGSC 9923 / NRRL Y-1056) TaxID=284811 RepID=Q751R0_EREGS|nr:AGL304Wp [Eremothecium gossypii ATCC 10895]AAS54187.1 AGL304Wp [Eremothecium gossypii ATCC 10895]AEY98513.1 FAGL304Wp [Eremothecium gossypii FDAG1]
MEKRPYKRALKQFDVNVQRKRSLRNKNSFMNDSSSVTSPYENDERNKENKVPSGREIVRPTLFENSPTTDGNLTEEINECIDKRCADRSGGSRLTKDALVELQLLIREFEVQQFAECKHAFCQQGLGIDNLCQCRTNFLFELEFFEGRDKIEAGNLRRQCYCKRIYTAIDSSWHVSPADDSAEQWEGLEWLLLPKIEPRSVATAELHGNRVCPDEGVVRQKSLPATVLQIRSSHRVFDESVDLSEIFKQWSSSSSVSNWDPPNDSFEHCPSAQAKCALKKRILRPSDIVFPK